MAVEQGPVDQAVQCQRGVRRQPQLFDLSHRQEIHPVAGIESLGHAVNAVDGPASTAHLRIVFDVVDDQGAGVQDLDQ